MNRAKIQERIMEFSRDIDNTTVAEFHTDMRNRLSVQRQKGRTGWELMEAHELADKMCKAIQKDNDYFFLDLANLLMFAHALEIDPSEIRGVLEAHLGRNWTKRKEVKAGMAARKADVEPKPELPRDGAVYNLRVDGAGCLYQYMYRGDVQAFVAVDENGDIQTSQIEFSLDDPSVEWGEC